MMLLAKALYDNIAESPEELAMRRGDILTVLEQDTSGLEGWWLCSLKGRRGIVPGNRLRLLDKALGQREMSLMNANLFPTERNTVQKQWHDPNKVVIPQRLGNMFVYDVPKRADSSGHYDIPPSRRTVSPRPAPRSTISDYDHPPSSRPVMNKFNSNLDTVQHFQTQGTNLDHYDVPGSNRSSTVSMMSTGSNISAVSSGSGAHSSLCESERSSLDLSGQDVYDVPPPTRTVPIPATRRLPPGSSVDSPMYDTPKPHKYGHKHSKSLDMLDETSDLLKSDACNIIMNHSEPMPTYSVPKPIKPVSRNCSADSGISLALKNQLDQSSVPTYDVPIPQYDTPARCKSVGDSLDYDTPKSCSTVQERSSEVGTPADVSVYDVPPRVTKDTGSSLERVMDDIKRVSSGSSDSDAGTFPYEELRMELTAAMESIMSLQHNLNSSCSKLLAFVHPLWRHPDHLEPQIYQIKLSALAVKTSCDEFVQFAQGALANAAKSDDKKLAKKLCSAIEMLFALLKTFMECLQKLNKDMWPLVKLVRDEGSALGEDDLDVIIRITKDIPECVRRISGLIQGNSLVLFRRSESPNISAAPLTSTPKAKARPPPPVKPKPRLSVGNGNGVPLAKFVSKSVDSTPTSEEPPFVKASPTALEHSLDVDKIKRGSFDQVDYDIPKSNSMKTKSSSTDFSAQRGLPDGATTLEEYDYVSLTKDPSLGKGLNPGVQAAENEIQKEEQPMYAQVKKDSSRSRQIKSLFPPSPDDVSPKLEERLEQLRKDAEEPVKIHTEDYDIPHSCAIDSTPSRSPSVTVTRILPNDRQILSFYAIQMETHSAILMNAIGFIKCIDEQQSPKVFIAYSKYVILAAHKLVYIGDTLTRHLVHENIRNDVVSHAYTLCELLKGTVTSTKKAALEYPAVQAVQEMVDKVSEVSVAASRFRTLLSQFAS